MRRIAVALLSLALAAGTGLGIAVPDTEAAPAVSPLFLYTVNDGIANTVSGYRVAHDGSLTELAGSPFATGGAGVTADLESVAFISAVTGTLVRAGDRLYAANMGAAPATISGFSINPVTGVLAPLPGSPYALGFTDEFSMAITPDGKYLYAGQSGAPNVERLPVRHDGSLNTAARTDTAVLARTDGMAVSPDGRWLAIGGANGADYTVASLTEVLSINARTGALAEAAGSPLAVPSTAVAFGPTRHGVSALYAGDMTGGISAFAVTGTGITPTSSLSTSGPYPSLQSLAVLGDGSMVYAVDPWERLIYRFAVDHNGILSLAGTPMDAGPGVIAQGLALDPHDRLLFSSLLGTYADGVAPAWITGYRVGAAGALTPLSGFPRATGQPGALRSIVVYEGKAPVATSVAYRGSTAVTTGGSLRLEARLTPAACGGGVSFSLDRNPKTGAAGPYALTGTIVRTGGWRPGSYTVTVTYRGHDACLAAATTASLRVLSARAHLPGSGDRRN